MGLSRSKPREKKVEEQKKNSTNFVTKSKEKVMEKESKHSDKEALNQPADSLLFGSGTAKHSRPSSSSEGFLCVALRLSWNSLGSPGWPRTHRDPHASASRVLGLQVCDITARRNYPFESRQ